MTSFVQAQIARIRRLQHNLIKRISQNVFDRLHTTIDYPVVATVRAFSTYVTVKMIPRGDDDIDYEEIIFEFEDKLRRHQLKINQVERILAFVVRNDHQIYWRFYSHMLIVIE